MKHELKTKEDYFRSIWAGTKTFEIRINDRDFHVDDEVVLEETMTSDRDIRTGREVEGWITYLTDFEQKPGYVVFSFKESHRRE